LEAEFLIAMVLANQTLPIFEVATGEGVVDEKATALHRARCLNTLGLAAEKFTYDPLINRAVAGLYPRGAASSQALGEYLKDQAIQWGEATNPNFIKALIDAGAKPPKLGSWSSDPTLVAAFKNLALWTYTNDALSWLTGINIITGNHVGGHQKTLFFEAVCRELVSADKALTPMRISAIEAYLHLVAFSEEFRHSLKETLTRSFRPQDLAEAKITAIDYALQKVKELQRRSDLQKPYLSALEILLKDPVTLSNYVQMQIAEVEGQTLEAYGDRLKSLMEVRFPSSADDQGHSILTYLVESGRSGLASDFLGALSQDKTVEEEPVRLVEAERLKAFVNYQAKVHEKAAPAEGEAAGALDIKQRSALRILTANTTPEEYSAGDHNLLIQLVSLGAEIPADVLLFEDAVKWFCTYSRPFSKTLEGFYSELKDRDNVTQVSEDALAKYPGDTEENAKAHALERCKLYAAALKVPYPLLDGFLNPALS